MLTWTINNGPTRQIKCTRSFIKNYRNFTNDQCFQQLQLSYPNINIWKKELYVHVAKTQGRYYDLSVFKVYIRVYYIILMYSCMHVKIKYYTKFQYMYIDPTLFTLYLHILNFFLICFYVNKGMFLHILRKFTSVPY